MNTIFLIITALFTVTNTYSTKQENSDITVEITNLRNNKGVVLISLFNNEKDFPGEAEKAVRKAKIEITGNKALITFKDFPPGNYAAAILHDENNNLKMDFNFLGIPKEGYGFSNNAKGMFGPPAFNKASFEINGETKKINIKAVYF